MGAREQGEGRLCLLVVVAPSHACPHKAGFFGAIWWQCHRGLSLDGSRQVLEVAALVCRVGRSS